MLNEVSQMVAGLQRGHEEPKADGRLTSRQLLRTRDGHHRLDQRQNCVLCAKHDSKGSTARPRGYQIVQKRLSHQVGSGPFATPLADPLFRYIRFALEQHERGVADLYKIEQLRAMHLADEAWNEVTSATITNCFRHTGIV